MGENIKLRHAFISMLFALVVGQIAIVAFDIFKSFTWGLVWWTTAKYQVSHLVVSIILVTTSWVGWSDTFNDPNYPKIDGYFSRGYALLLIDVIILIFYFSVVMAIEKAGIGGSAKPETFLLMNVFILYTVWDAFFSSKKWEVRVIELLPSGFCALVILLVYLLLPDEYVILTDIFLVIILLSFRSIKKFQTDLTNET